MKKISIFASFAVMTASVFGMDNTLPADYDQSTSSVPVKHKDSKEEAKKTGRI